MRAWAGSSIRRRIIATVSVVGVAVAVAAPAHALDPFPTPTLPASPPGQYTEQVLASNGDNGIDPVLGRFYRIVALADLGNGNLLAAYDGRPSGGDAPQPNSIIQRRSMDGGRTWGPPSFIARGQVGAAGVPQYGFSDPSYVVDRETGTVFNFHVYSKDQGFAGSRLGNDDADRNVISAQVSVSVDGGLTWSTGPANQPSLPPPGAYPAGSRYADFAGPLITTVVKPVGRAVDGVPDVGGVVGMFASSGQGIQLRYGSHKGRLLQQFAGTVVQPDGSRTVQAYSVYSDDHGHSWHIGEPVGTAMDENKTVELSDGRVMLNSRDSSGTNPHYRKVAISSDGGVTYAPSTVETQLPDPRNNAALIRMFPDAAQGTADARKLLFANSPTPTAGGSRSNGTIRYSPDDGQTWTSARLFKPGAMSYATLAALGDGTFGLLYEGDNNAITFARFNAAWLSPAAIGLTVAPTSGANGATADVAVTVTNHDDVALPSAIVNIDELADWSSGTADVTGLPAGATRTVTVPLAIPVYAKAGTRTFIVRLRMGASFITAAAPVTVTGGTTENVVGAYVFGTRNDTGRDLGSDPYAVGSSVPYQFRVYSAGNITETVVPTAGQFAPFLPPGGGNCRFTNLPAWADFLCTTPRHTVTTGELAQGYFVPVTTWEVSGQGARSMTYTLVGDEVDLVVRRASLTTTVAGTWQDVDGSGYANPGDTVSYRYTATNTGNVTLTDIAAPAVGLAADSLAVGASVSSTTSRVLGLADIAAKASIAPVITVRASNGSRPVTSRADESVIVLPDRCATNLSGTVSGTVNIRTGEYCVAAPGTVVTGNVSVAPGASLLVGTGRITGNVIVGNGTLTALGTRIVGNLQATGSSSVQLAGADITGNVNLQQLTGSVQVCGTTTRGNLMVHASRTTQTIQIGSVSDLAACAGNAVTGNLLVQANLVTADPGSGEAVVIGSNTVTGNVVVSANGWSPGNAAPAALVGRNRIAGSLTCAANMGAPHNGGVANTVRGNRTGQCAGL